MELLSYQFPPVPLTWVHIPPQYARAINYPICLCSYHRIVYRRCSGNILMFESLQPYYPCAEAYFHCSSNIRVTDIFSFCSDHVHSSLYTWISFSKKSHIGILWDMGGKNRSVTSKTNYSLHVLRPITVKYM